MTSNVLISCGRRCFCDTYSMWHLSQEPFAVSAVEILMYCSVIFNVFPCRCGLCDPAGGQPDQTQPGGDRGRPGDGVHEDPEHLQNDRNQVQAQRAIWGDHRWRQEDKGQCGLRAKGGGGDREMSNHSQGGGSACCFCHGINSFVCVVLPCRPWWLWRTANLCRNRAGTAKKQISRGRSLMGSW